MSITETSLEPEILTLIQNCSKQAAQLLQLDLETSSTADMIARVDQCVHEMQRGRGPQLAEDEDPPYLFGSLWGHALCEALGWQWANVVFHDHDDAEAVGVFSPDRSLAIYPFHFIYGCLENDAPVTIELAFNMLVDGSQIPVLPPGGYEDVMDHVHHIVPRE